MATPLRFLKAAKMIARIMYQEQFYCTYRDFGELLLADDDSELITRLLKRRGDSALRIGDEDGLEVKYKRGNIIYGFIFTSDKISRAQFTTKLKEMDTIRDLDTLFIIYSHPTPVSPAGISSVSEERNIQTIRQIHLNQMSIDTTHHMYAMGHELVPRDDQEDILKDLGIATYLHLPIIRDDDMAIVFKGWKEEGRIVRQITKTGNIVYRRILHKPRNYELVGRR